MVFLDTIGIDDGLIRMPIELHKQGEELIIDLAGASPEPKIGPFHLRWHLARAASAAALFPTVFRGLRWSIGLFDPVKLTAPPSILNAPSRDSGTGSGSHAGRVVVQGLLLAAMRMLHDSAYREGVVAPFAENLLLMGFGGQGNTATKSPVARPTATPRGKGARFDLDGEHSAGFFWAMVVDCPGPEEQERKFPWTYLFRNRFDRDVAGMGRYRGGVGLTDCFVIHGTEGLDTTRWEREPVHEELRALRRLLRCRAAPNRDLELRRQRTHGRRRGRPADERSPAGQRAGHPGRLRLRAPEYRRRSLQRRRRVSSSPADLAVATATCSNAMSTPCWPTSQTASHQRSRVEDLRGRARRDGQRVDAMPLLLGARASRASDANGKVIRMTSIATWLIARPPEEALTYYGDYPDPRPGHQRPRVPRLPGSRYMSRFVALVAPDAMRFGTTPDLARRRHGSGAMPRCGQPALGSNSPARRGCARPRMPPWRPSSAPRLIRQRASKPPMRSPVARRHARGPARARHDLWADRPGARE